MIDNWCPVTVYINNELVWEDEDGIEEYKKIMLSEALVASVRFNIVHFHHSVVFIDTI